MPEPNPTPTEQDDFAAAFAQALKDDAPKEPAPAAGITAQDPPGGEKPPAEEPAPAKEEAAPAKEEAAPAGEEAAAAAVETAAAAATEVAPAPAPAPAATETPEAELARLRAENAAYKAAQAAPAPKQAEPAPAAEAAPAPAQKIADPKWYQPTEDETARLANFQKDWPDIYEATQVATKQAAYNVAEYIFNQIAKVYNPTLEQFAQDAQTIREQIALTELRGSHKDYDAIYDNVVAWVDTLPAPFKRGALETMKTGTPDEVSALIQAYKNATGAAPAGTPAAAPAGGAPVPTAPKTTGLSAAANKAASKLQVVGSKRTTPTPQADANDFDGAWAEALRQNG